MEDDLLTDVDLARRWKVEVVTICQWRWNGKGPRFFKQGRQAFYRPEDVRRYEEQKSRKSTAAQDIEEETPAIYKIRHSQRKRRFT
ncbi:MAG: DNA-binding protein [Alphaproteobacteria bacterium]|nr:DNA-binding protein [Alphaproteobacteria bacterium]